MSIGWLLIHRKLMDKPIWKGSTPEQKVILVTLLMMVDFKPSEWEWQGEKYNTKPGEKITSIATIKALSGKGISTQNVRAALKRFEKLEFLTNKSTKTGRLISIINWDSYQQDQQSAQHSNQQRANKEPTPNEQGNKEKNKKKEDTACDFDRFWNLYAKKKDTAKCKAKWKNISIKDKETIFETLGIYLASTPDKQYRKNPLTYLNGEIWKDDFTPEGRFDEQGNYLNPGPEDPFKGECKAVGPPGEIFHEVVAEIAAETKAKKEREAKENGLS